MTDQSEFYPGTRIVTALLALTAIRFGFAAYVNFIDDEAYYRLWGLYPSYAYFDHAPMVGWWIAIGQMFFGDTHFGLRFFAPLASFVGSLLFWRATYIGFDRRIADRAVIYFNAMPLIGIGSVIMTPDVPSVFFWGLGMWIMAEWSRSHRPILWLYFGIAAGFGLLSKYTNVFLGAGVLLWLITSGQWRIAIRTPYFWFAGLIAALLFSPVVYWNAIHDWASFSKQLGRLQNGHLTLAYLGEWIGGQALVISPIIFVFMVLGIRYSRNLLQQPKHAASLILMSGAPLLFYFLYHSFTSRINANWTAPLMINFAVLAAFGVERIEIEQRSFWRRVLRLSAPLGLLLTGLILIEAAWPFLPVDRRNPIEQIRGYDEFAKDLEGELEARQATMIATSRYHVTGQLSYALHDRVPIVQIFERIRFLNMPPLDKTLLQKRMLYVADEKEAGAFIKANHSCFASAEFIRSIARTDRGVAVKTYNIWQIDGFNPQFLLRGDPGDC